MTLKRILVPVDFSPPSLQALDYAIKFGRPLRAEFVLVHAVEPMYFAATNGIYGVGHDASIFYREIERSAGLQLAKLAARLRRRHVRVRILLLVGRPHQAIADAAKKLKADLVIMATHGRSGLSHVVLGSVAERVVRTAPCAVLTIRPKPAAARRRTVRRQAARA
jgi:nucleotide-binding universal stress UspA family protein